MLPETVHHCLDHGLGTAVAEEAAAVPASTAAGAAAVAGHAHQAVEEAAAAAASEAAGAAAVAGRAHQAVAAAGLSAVDACLAVHCPLCHLYQRHCLCH